MLGDVFRSCDRGGCIQRAVLIGTYLDALQCPRTAAACGDRHRDDLVRQIPSEIVWKPFPAPLAPETR